jgi:hypothetical protein
LEFLNVTNDLNEDQEVNDYTIHKILQIEILYNKLLHQFNEVWHQCANFWEILSKEELETITLERNLKNFMIVDNEFNTIFMEISTLS